MSVQHIFYAEAVYQTPKGSSVGLEKKELAPEAFAEVDVIILQIVVNTWRLS